MTEKRKVNNAMTYNEAVAALGVSQETLRTYIKKGRIKSKKIGRCTYISREDVESLLNDF